MYCPRCRCHNIHSVVTERQNYEKDWILVTVCSCGRILSRWYPDPLYKLARENGDLFFDETKEVA